MFERFCNFYPGDTVIRNCYLLHAVDFELKFWTTKFQDFSSNCSSTFSVPFEMSTMNCWVTNFVNRHKFEFDLSFPPNSEPPGPRRIWVSNCHVAGRVVFNSISIVCNYLCVVIKHATAGLSWACLKTYFRQGSVIWILTRNGPLRALQVKTKHRLIRCLRGLNTM